jgi:cysteinyl-tRNA synthetase
LESAEKGLEKIYNLVHRLENIIPSSEKDLYVFESERYIFAFESAMDDNFNSPKALAAIYDFARDINKFLNKNDKISQGVIDSAKDFLKSTLEDVLGLSLFKQIPKKDSKENELIHLLIELRKNAKNEKNYAFADLIRSKLSELGIILEDSKEGTKFKFSNK